MKYSILKNSKNRIFLALILSILLTGCGFVLKPQELYPLKTLTVISEDRLSVRLAKQLKSRIKDWYPHVYFVEEDRSPLVLKLNNDTRSRVEQVIASTGLERDYRVEREVLMSMTDRSGKEWALDESIIASRSLRYNTVRSATKEIEEQEIWEEVEEDLLKKIIFRLNVIANQIKNDKNHAAN